MLAAMMLAPLSAVAAGVHDEMLPVTEVYSGIRPGMPIKVIRSATTSSACTANFVWQDSETGTYYIGTAGHCIARTSAAGTTWAYGSGPAVYVGSDADELGRKWGDAGSFVGHAIYARYFSVPVGPFPGGALHLDFGLVQVAAASAPLVEPAMAHFGGPTGLRGDPHTGDKIHQYGWGYQLVGVVALGGSKPTFEHGGTGFVAGRTDHQFSFNGIVATGGDSGSPIIDGEGRALGVQTTLVCVHASPCAGGANVAQLLANEIAAAEERLRASGALSPSAELVLRTAPYTPAGGAPR